VPEKDARKVMTQLTGIRYKGRTVRCNSEDDKSKNPSETSRTRDTRKPRNSRESRKTQKDDWRSLMNVPRVDFKGEEPDFSEEGWARRKPKKKK
jgi:ATP-dependent RNA helicase DeaD